MRFSLLLRIYLSIAVALTVLFAVTVWLVQRDSVAALVQLVGAQELAAVTPLAPPPLPKKVEADSLTVAQQFTTETPIKSGLIKQTKSAAPLKKSAGATDSFSAKGMEF